MQCLGAVSISCMAYATLQVGCKLAQLSPCCCWSCVYLPAQVFMHVADLVMGMFAGSCLMLVGGLHFFVVVSGLHLHTLISGTRAPAPQLLLRVSLAPLQFCVSS